MAMNEKACNHCGKMVREDQSSCPYCGSPSPFPQNQGMTAVQKKFILFFLATIVLCIILILWFPR